MRPPVIGHRSLAKTEMLFPISSYESDRVCFNKKGHHCSQDDKDNTEEFVNLDMGVQQTIGRQ